MDPSETISPVLTTLSYGSSRAHFVAFNMVLFIAASNMMYRILSRKSYRFSLLCFCKNIWLFTICYIAYMCIWGTYLCITLPFRWSHDNIIDDSSELKIKLNRYVCTVYVYPVSNTYPNNVVFFKALFAILIKILIWI